MLILLILCAGLAVINLILAFHNLKLAAEISARVRDRNFMCDQGKLGANLISENWQTNLMKIS